MLPIQTTKCTESTTNGFRQRTPVRTILSARQEALLADLPPEMRTLVYDIKDWVENGARRSLISRYEFGCQIKAAYDDQTNGGRDVYGRNVIEILREVLPYQMTFVYQHMLFVRYYSRREVEKMAWLPMANGRLLSWSHVRILLKVRGPVQRAELLGRTRAESWTSGQLDKEQKRLRGDKPEKRGRHLTRPKNLAELIWQQTSIADNYLKRSAKVWTVPENSLPAHFKNVSRDEYSDELAQQLKEYIDTHRRMGKEACARASEAEPFYEEVKEAVSREKAAEALTQATKPGTDAGDTADRSFVAKQRGAGESGQLPGPRTAAPNAKRKRRSARKSEKALEHSHELVSMP